jgi:quinol monooxygenase YgiN
MSEIYVYGTYRVRPGFEARVHASLSEHEARTRAEPGCLHAAVSADLEDPSRLYTMQRWADQAALEAHRALPHVVSLSGGASEVLAEPFVLTVLVPG